MRPGRKTWWVVLMLMIVLPTSLWRTGASDDTDIRIVVHEPQAAICAERTDANSEGACPEASGERPDMEKPGLSRAD
jgi:hypothetical protein